MLPAQQDLSAADTLVAQRELGLQHEHEFAWARGSAQLRKQRELLRAGVAEARFEAGPAGVAAAPFVQRDLGVAHQGLHGVAVHRVQGQSEHGAEVDRLPRHVERCGKGLA